MINIKQGLAKNLKTKESLFVSFEYNLEVVNAIKSLPNRYYIPATREWEIPIKDVNLLLNSLQKHEIKLTGKANTKIEGAVSQSAKIDQHEMIYNPKTKPFKHQEECFEYSKSHNKFLLGDEQGLGKTKQIIDIAIARKSEFKHALIVCGVNGLKWNWLKEVQIHSNEKAHIIGTKVNSKGKLVEGGNAERLEDLDKDHNEFFLIINVESLRNEEIAAKLAAMCNSGKIGMVAIDEVHKCCNPTAQQTKGMLQLQSYYKVAMTGTPLMNKPLDLFVPLKWLNVENHSFYAFKNHYCTMGGYGGYEVVGYKNMKQLQTQLNGVMLRRLKDDVLDLPAKIHSVEYVEMTDKQRVVYKGILNAIKSDIMTIKANPNPLAQLIRLRQATGWTGIVSKIEESSKMERLIELVEDKVESGEKVIVFSSWTDMTHVIEEKLQKFNPAVITGEINNRMEMLEKFQTDNSCKVIVGTIGAMGTGLTLTAASTVIFLDEPWNRALKDQAEDRAHRIGQNNTVNVITLITKDTIDERVNELVVQKGEMSDALIDGQLDKMNKEKLIDYLLS